MIAIAVSYGLEFVNDSIRTPDDVSRHLRVPFLGFVPSVPVVTPAMMVPSQSGSFGEPFRAIRTALTARYPAKGTKTLIVTSTQPLEGKTTTAVNIAMALADIGSRVLLIDADMRRPGLHRALGLTNDRGLSQVLAGQARVGEVIQPTSDPRVVAVTAGPTTSQPSELLSSERMNGLLAQLAYAPFEWVILDTPPVLAVTDAVILADKVSGVVFTVGAAMTRRRHAQRAINTLLMRPANDLAVVLNKVDLARDHYYYSHYHGQGSKNHTTAHPDDAPNDGKSVSAGRRSI
jgi:capsular exopolysaccharide synthesis family protein